MKTHRIEATLTENGTLTIKNLPFQAGEAVEVIILERHSRTLKEEEARKLIEQVDDGYRFQVELIRRWFAK